ncbi:hypothetical protein GCM10011400_32710 [Paraburkholderia caffeinilytica]|uniref:Uncharacterized protein n=1 Tax=Paraburkholderia caffeinilytica TaxID=1761016 RepID=A0ABQ1MM55_9BURK|nr:hypothetical protein GCM10011400_32710 [Paraburkholderia caffeinilytica]
MYGPVIALEPIERPFRVACYAWCARTTARCSLHRRIARHVELPRDDPRIFKRRQYLRVAGGDAFLQQALGRDTASGATNEDGGVHRWRLPHLLALKQKTQRRERADVHELVLCVATGRERQGV